MADIKSALEQALAAKVATAVKEWDTDEKPATKEPMTTTTLAPDLTRKQSTGVSQAIFDYVRQNPDVEARAAVMALIAQGFNPSSIPSLIAVLVKRGVLGQDSSGRLRTLSRSLTRSYTKKAPVMISRTPPAPAPAPTGLATLQAAPVQPIVLTSRVDNIINQLSIAEAREMLNKLESLFKG